MTTTDIVLENETLFNAFVHRFKEMNLGWDRLVAEMDEDGIVMDKKRLQRFIKYGVAKRITQKAYIWLLARHGVDISLHAKGVIREDELNRKRAKEVAQAI
jgi:hypothetical protein